MKRLVTVVTPAILLAESIRLDLNDLNVSIDTGTANNEVTAVWASLKEERLLDRDKGRKSEESGGNTEGMLRLEEVT